MTASLFGKKDEATTVWSDFSSENAASKWQSPIPKENGDFDTQPFSKSAIDDYLYNYM